MGIISPKKPNGISRFLLTLLLISLSPILITALLLYLLWGIILYFSIWLAYPEQLVIFVYSDSPTWKDYIEREILPQIRNRAVILNWSGRRHWKNSFAVLAFQYFGGYRNFNPIAIIFRTFCFAKTYRFYEAFKEFKHGHVQKVEEIKRESFDDIEI